jgi:hypothetical protein
MARDPFDEALVHVPDEQRRLLERMMELGLVTRIVMDDKSGRGVVDYTPKGRDFIELVEAVCSTKPSRRQARLMALCALSVNGYVWTGYKK